MDIQTRPAQKIGGSVSGTQPTVRGAVCGDTIAVKCRQLGPMIFGRLLQAFPKNLKAKQARSAPTRQGRGGLTIFIGRPLGFLWKSLAAKLHTCVNGKKPLALLIQSTEKMPFSNGRMASVWSGIKRPMTNKTGAVQFANVLKSGRSEGLNFRSQLITAIALERFVVCFAWIVTGALAFSLTIQTGLPKPLNI